MSDKTETGDDTESGKKKTLKLGGKGTLQLKKSVEGAAPARRSASGSRGGKQVVVERRRRRVVSKEGEAAAKAEEAAEEIASHLTDSELAARARVLEQAEQERRTAPKKSSSAADEAPVQESAPEEFVAEEPAESAVVAEADATPEEAVEAPVAEVSDDGATAEAGAKTARADDQAGSDGGPKIIPRPKPAPKPAAKPAARQGRGGQPAAQPEPDLPAREDTSPARRKGLPERDRETERVRPAPRTGEGERRRGKLTVARALADDLDERQRSLAAMRRAREKQKAAARQAQEPREKVFQEVVVPDVITVGELANRMTERSADVIRSLMKMGMMATINQEIDQDTAELLVEEFGHKIKRVSESDVEIGLTGDDDDPATLKSRPPVVTVMGHVDHGKTSLLDALREADVVAGEAGGITQHIGAYQVTLPRGDVVTFLDTPGHAAFTAMRARGAQVTDIVVLVVAADDSIMPQTVEAIQHAKAAHVPIVVAINKIDKPDANPDKVRQELLQYDVQVEGMGGDTLCVEVSATQKIGLDKLLEALHLQAELMELKANPDRPAEGAVIEATMEKGRGSVATLLVVRGTLRVGDIFVAGAEWGRVRALIDEHGQQLDEAGPSRPCEVLGLNGTPEAGDDFIVVENEARAREVTEYRHRERKKAAHIPAARPATLEAMMGELKARERAELPILVKADVQGSAEAITAAVVGLSTEEVTARVIYAGVGAISESDVNLAKTAGAPILAFNVRPNSQAKKLAETEGVEIRLYSVIYDLVDDVKGVMSGMLAPEIRETALGMAEVRDVFSAGKTGKAAGCLVMEGTMKAGARVRLLRDSVVVHDGKILSLRRFKDEVREVNAGTECGITLENFSDVKVGDVIEAFDVEEVARSL